MPYTLTTDPRGDVRLRLWPHNTLPARGFAWVIAITGAALLLPLLALLGTPFLWGLLPFAGLVLWALWYALRRNWRDRQILEEMRLGRTQVSLRHVSPDGTVLEWQADPHWVALRLTPRGGPVENYLTLTGGGKAVELGAFLTPEERAALHDDLSQHLIRLRSLQ